MLMFLCDRELHYNYFISVLALLKHNSIHLYDTEIFFVYLLK